MEIAEGSICNLPPARSQMWIKMLMDHAAEAIKECENPRQRKFPFRFDGATYNACLFTFGIKVRDAKGNKVALRYD